MFVFHPSAHTEAHAPCEGEDEQAARFPGGHSGARAEREENDPLPESLRDPPNAALPLWRGAGVRVWEGGERSDSTGNINNSG